MRKWLSLLFLGMLLALPWPVAAQDEIRLSRLSVDLWPEYDQPSMLVLYDFELPANASLPVSVSFRLPTDANVIAVAALENGVLTSNVAFNGPITQGEWQVLTITVDKPTSYHFEYYQPLTFLGMQRQFAYLWPGDYAVGEFTLRVQQPTDTTSIQTAPALQPVQDANDGFTYYVSPVTLLEKDNQYTLNLQYDKTSETLTRPSAVEPVQPLDQATAGRVSITNYLPYILGGLGLLFVAVGVGYRMMMKRPKVASPRHRSRSRGEDSGEGGGAYCSQCGQRARAGDRFCRVCGSRMRQEG